MNLYSLKCLSFSYRKSKYHSILIHTIFCAWKGKRLLTMHFQAELATCYLPLILASLNHSKNTNLFFYASISVVRPFSASWGSSLSFLLGTGDDSRKTLLFCIYLELRWLSHWVRDKFEIHFTLHIGKFLTCYFYAFWKDLARHDGKMYSSLVYNCGRWGRLSSWVFV